MQLRWSSPHVLKYDEFASYMRCHACASHTPPVQVIDAWEALEVDQEQRQERLAGMSPQELRNETGFNLLDAIDVMLIKLLRQPDQEALIPRQVTFLAGSSLC